MNEESNRDVEIRRATREDIPAIASILLASFEEFRPLYTPGGFSATTPTSEAIDTRFEDGPAWVAVYDGRVVGTVAAVPGESGLYVRSMAVLPEARGRRTGELLLEEVEAFAHAQGCQRMFLSTTPFLGAAIRLYERFGFTRRNTGPQDLHGTPLFSMEKFLQRTP